MIKAIILKGGGQLGCAYGGALEVLEDRDILQNVNSFAGTSAGAITALMLALGYNSKEIFDIALNKNFKDLLKNEFLPVAIWKLRKDKGWYELKPFETWIKSIIKKKLGSGYATFSDLKNDLIIPSFNEDRQEIVYFSNETHPDIELYKAVTGSMAIPIYFEAQKINGETYTDGGISANFPIAVYDNKYKKSEVLGLYLGNKDTKAVKPGKGIINRIKLYFLYLHEKACSTHIKEGDKIRTIYIDTLDYSATDFDMSETDKKLLILSGKNATLEYFNKK